MASSFLTSRPFMRVFAAPKFKFVAIFFVVSTVLLLTSYKWGSIKTIATSDSFLGGEEGPDYWDWDTVTSFQTHTAKTSDDICHDFPTDVLARVQITLKVGATESTSRTDSSLNGVTKCVNNLLVVADRATELHGHYVHDVLSDLYPFASRLNISDFELWEALQRNDPSVDGEAGWKLDKWKFLPMVEQAKKKNPTADWFVFMETDTYFVWDNLFRLLDQFDPSVPLYFGSPSPGFGLEDGGRVWFAYGGSGFIISRGAMDKLTERKTGKFGEYLSPSLSEKYMEVVDRDCCGDSVLGFALYEAGVKLSGLWPMFNAHSLQGLPFDHVHWCQPVVSLHKTLLSDMIGLAKWEAKRNRTKPLLYADLIDYLKLGYLSDKPEWDNGDFSGAIEPPESAAHGSLESCRKACHENADCFGFTYDSKKTCVFVHTMRLGQSKKIAEGKLTVGWDNEKILAYRKSHQCERPLWVKPSISRIF